MFSRDTSSGKKVEDEIETSAGCLSWLILAVIPISAMISPGMAMIALLVAPVMMGGVYSFVRKQKYEERLLLQQSNADRLTHALQMGEYVAPFILYLRPFSMDQLQYWRSDLGGLVDTGVVKSTTLDESLFIFLAGRAQVVCLGEPKEAVGAARIESNDSKWRKDVELLMNCASRIVLVPGDSLGITEELVLVWSSPELRKKCYIVMPPAKSGFFISAMWKRAVGNAKLLGIDLPMYHSGGAVFTPSGKWFWMDYQSPEAMCQFIIDGL